MKAIIAHLSQLASFNGRESRSAFWPYFGCAFAVAMVASWIAMVPLMSDMMAKASRLAMEDPSAVTTTVGPGSYSVRIEAGPPEVMPDLGPFFVVMDVMVLALVVLLAAAVCRRLHDSGLRGWFGLMPLPFLATGFAVFPKLMRQFATSSDPDMALFGLMFANNIAYLAAVGGLVLLLVRVGTPGENRFGPPPEPGS